MTNLDLADKTGHRMRNPDHPTRMEHIMLQTWKDRPPWQIGQCKVCGADIPQPRIEDATDVYSALVASMAVTVCPNCVDLVDGHYGDQRISKSTTPRWDAECPKLFQRIIKSEINPPKIDSDTIARVARWTWSPRGMILVGNSGLGKTTALWALFRNLEEAGTTADYWSSVELGKEISRCQRDLESAHHLTSKSVLIIDDLGKEKVSNTAAGLWWRLIDIRYERQLPMIISTRFTGQDFEDRFSAQSDRVGEPVIAGDIRRRLRDMCQVIAFRGSSNSREASK